MAEGNKMGQFFVANRTIYPVRVTVTRPLNEPDVRRVILTSKPIEVKEKIVVQATICLNTHESILVPHTPNEFTVKIDNHIGAVLKRQTDQKGNHILAIIGFSC
jgi:hypothetical protein